jgi:outer membrane protein assembly factor BamB
MDNQTIAFNGINGEQLWSHRGISSSAGVLGAATPAITRDAVIAAYGSGEVYALQINTGRELWSENLSSLARNAGQTRLSDVRALPVFDENTVYAASINDKMSAINAFTGQPVWQISVGTASTPWVSGNRIFAIESQGSLVSLDRATGSIIWQVVNY